MREENDQDESVHSRFHFAILEVNGRQIHIITPPSSPPRQSGPARGISHLGGHPPDDAGDLARPPRPRHLELVALISTQ